MISQPDGTANYLVTEGRGTLPVGDIAPGVQGQWVFWPAVYRQPVTMAIAAEILACLEELNT